MKMRKMDELCSFGSLLGRGIELNGGQAAGREVFGQESGPCLLGLGLGLPGSYFWFS